MLHRPQKHIQPRSEQHAFRAEHSTTTQLIELVDNLMNNLNKGYQTTEVFLDITQAFDRIWHKGLLHKLRLQNTPLLLI